MATGNPNTGSTGTFFYDRSTTNIVNANKISGVFDYAYGRFLAWDHFFRELSRVQNSVLNKDGVVKLITGETADIKEVGGALAVNIYTESLESAKEAMDGLSNLGLKNENKLWQLR